MMHYNEPYETDSLCTWDSNTMPETIQVGDVEYIRKDKIKPSSAHDTTQYIMRIVKVNNYNEEEITSIKIKINDTIIMEIDNNEASIATLYDEADILKKWVDGGYICDNQAVKWNDAEFYLYKGELYCAYNFIGGFIGGYKNNEMIYNFKTMKQGDRTQAPVPIWEHSETLKVV